MEGIPGVLHRCAQISAFFSDPRLAVFRDFVNSLDVDLEEGHREGPGPLE